MLKNIIQWLNVYFVVVWLTAHLREEDNSSES